jgi:HEPN superfamily AbiU2-like protein
MTTVRVSSTFEQELETFGNEQSSAQQYFFGFLSLQLIPSKNPDVLRQMRETSTFWIATRYALLMSAFVVLGRIFDQDRKSLHNIDKLLTAVSNEIGTLSKTGLLHRRIAQGMDPEQAAAYAADTYELTVEDVRDMRKAVGKWRKVYEARFREIRHNIFAHKGLSRADADKRMAKTNIEEVKALLGFLHSLYMSLWQLHINGIAPNLTPATFDLPPKPGGSKAGELMYRESADLLYGMLDT